MAKKGYFIQPSKNSKEATLYLVVKTKVGTTAKVNVGVSVPVAEWTKFKKAKDTDKFFNNHKDIRDKVEAAEDIIATQVEEGVTSGSAISHAIAVTSHKEVKEKVDEALAVDRSILYKYVCWYIDEASKEDGIITKHHNAKRLSDSFIKTFNNMKANLKKELGSKKDSFTFSDITKRWSDKFRLDLLKDHAPATVKTYLSCLNIICRYALTDIDKEGRPANPNGGSVTLFGMAGMDETIKRNVDEILTDGSNGTCNEFKALYDMELEDKDEALVRDMFLWQCFVGQRMSDIVVTSPKDFNFELSYPVYLHKAKKTGITSEVAIVDPMAQEILKRHNYTFKKVGERFYNLHLRSVLHKLAQTLTWTNVEDKSIEHPLLRKVSTIITSQERTKEKKYLSIKAGTWKKDLTIDDKKMVAEMDEYAKEHGTYGNRNHLYEVDPNNEGKVLKFRWEVLTSHSGRRTFATLEFQKGLTAEEISVETGHKDTQTLIRKYKKTPTLWNAQNVAAKKMALYKQQQDKASKGMKKAE